MVNDGPTQPVPLTIKRKRGKRHAKNRNTTMKRVNLYILMCYAMNGEGPSLGMFAELHPMRATYCRIALASQGRENFQAVP